MKFLFFSLLVASPAQAVIYFATPDPAHNRETAPGGALAGSGWQYQGLFGNFLGTAISSNHFITAAHIPSAPTTFISKGYFNGGMDVTYTVDTTANMGLGYWNIAGTDLRIFQINETFSSYAPLYTNTDEAGKSLVVMGRGTQRGTDVLRSGNLIGWRWGASDGASRWGTNHVTSNVTYSGADYIYSTFDASVGGDEAHLSVGDSGGAVFLQDGGIWKLAGINYSVDGAWDYNNVVDTNEFNAALFDARGMYVGADLPTPSWTLVPDLGFAEPSGFYSTRISSYLTEISAITGVPEPGSVWLALMGAFALVRRRRG
jgi:hypothetical protein